MKVTRHRTKYINRPTWIHISNAMPRGHVINLTFKGKGMWRKTMVAFNEMICFRCGGGWQGRDEKENLIRPWPFSTVCRPAFSHWPGCMICAYVPKMPIHMLRAMHSKKWAVLFQALARYYARMNVISLLPISQTQNLWKPNYRGGRCLLLEVLMFLFKELRIRKRWCELDNTHFRWGGGPPGNLTRKVGRAWHSSPIVLTEGSTQGCTNLRGKKQ